MNTSEWFQWHDKNKTLFVFIYTPDPRNAPQALATSTTAKVLRQYAKKLRCIVCNTDGIMFRIMSSMTTYPKLIKIVVALPDHPTRSNSVYLYSSMDLERKTSAYPVLTKVLCSSQRYIYETEQLPPEYVAFVSEIAKPDPVALGYSLHESKWRFCDLDQQLLYYNYKKIEAACCLFLCLYGQQHFPKDVAAMITKNMVYTLSWNDWMTKEFNYLKKLKTK